MRHDAWNPGIESPLPSQLQPLCTFLRPENVLTTPAEAGELRDLTGLPECELVAFRPQRLALHEVLIRVTADFSVPDGERIEDLGINFRNIAGVVMRKYLAPRMDVITTAFEATRGQLSRLIEAELAALLEEPLPSSAKTGLLHRFTHWPNKRAPAKTCAMPSEDRIALVLAPRSRTESYHRTPSRLWDTALLSSWQMQTRSIDEALETTARRALGVVMLALLNRHGCAWGTRDLIASLATHIATNEAGSNAIGNAIEPLILEAARAEGYERLTHQPHPIVMNTKGPSASGKSSLRPLQKKLSGELGIRWRDFALISPDIWRKQLLDYSSLGSAYKYAGAFTADELRIVDQKFDRYMARKAQRGDLSHLLIDRFRFDSFAADSYEAGSNLLTRFGHIVYLFFLITPPDSLVERAWTRGLEVGRYKAVDDTLAHGVEAYSGMPDLLFTWIQRTDKRVHFEFLDNSVPFGERPRTVAFGTNEKLNVLDVKALLDVERYRKVNINARAASSLYTDPETLASQHNLGFFRKCVDRFHEVHFAQQATGRIYLTLVSGKPTFVDGEPLAQALLSANTRAALFATAASLFDQAIPASDRPRYLSDTAEKNEGRTVGKWGGMLN